MKVILNEKEFELKYTFNSFMYMEDLDLSELNDIANKPFKILSILKQLVSGGLNFDKKKTYSDEDVDTFLVELVKEADLGKVLEDLLGELEESDFFKNLRKK